MVDFKTLRQAFRAEYPDQEGSTQAELLLFQLIKAFKNEPITVPADTPVSSTIKVVSPQPGSEFVAGTPLEIFAFSTLPKTVGKVEFYVGATKIGEDRNLPYSILFTPTTVGALSLRVVAISPDGTTQVSSETVAVNVVASPTPITPNTPPTVSLVDPGTVTAGQTVTLTANASDSDGIAKVEFYQGSTKLGEDTTAPYTQQWTPSAGTYSLSAIAYDTKNAQTTSAAINITVAASAVPVPTVTVTAPSTATTGSAVTLSATASVTGDTIASVQFRVNGTNQGSADTTSPYNTSWTPSTAGTFTITAVATGTQGGTATSAGVTVTVTAPSIPTPTVTVTAPKAGLISESQSLAATAAVTGDTLTSVQFQINGTNQGAADTTSPYAVSWTPTTKGTYAVRAIATASQGGSTTSAVVNVPIYDTKLDPNVNGGAGAGCSLGAESGNYILFDNNQAGGGLAATMAINIGGNQVGAFNYTDTAYNGKPFAFFYQGQFYLGTVQTTVNF